MGFSGNVLKFDQNNNVEDFTLILSTKNYTHIGKLNNIKRDTVRYKGNLNGANEISFEVYKTLDGEIEQCWDKIVDFKSVYVKELNEYFEIKVTYHDAINEVKSITGTSLCEAELGQINIYGTEINTETDINRGDDYAQTSFYNPENPNASLLNRVLSFAKHYKIKYVDESLWRLQRSFSIDSTPIYDFLTGECAEQFNCLFVFNSVDRSISVYDLYSTCLDCGHRGAFNDICSECGSSYVTYFGEDTTIFVNKENLTEDVQFDTDTDSIKNCFKLTSGDVDMDMAIISQNPNGTAYLYTVPIEQREDMSEEFLQKFDAYNVLYDSYIDEYQQLSEQAYNLTDEINKYKYYMMPEPVDDGEEIETAISIASQEAAKLTSSNLSPIGLPTLSSSTSVTTVDSAIKNYARVFVNTGYVKVEVVEGSTFEYQGVNNNINRGQWRGSLRVTCFSNKEDVVVTEPMVIDVHDNYGDYCQQTAMKEVALVDEEGSIFNVLKIEDINEFKAALELYSLNRLESFSKAIDTALTTLMGLQQGSENAEWHDAIYVPYHDKLVACELEKVKRETTISELEIQLNEVQGRQTEIQNQLNFQDYLGEELYNEFCMYKREQEYNNSNFISDGLDNAQLMDYARQFIDTAQKELYKSSNRQHRISTTLHNLLVMPEFKDIVHKFALGNFIRIQVGNDIYRLRLISYEINFSDLTKISVEFSDMTKTSNGLNDVQSILQSASSMAKNYDSVSKQAEKGNVANTSINEMIESGLNSTTIKIINNVNEDVITDNNGILLRSWDDIEGAYKPNQLRLTHNVIAFTKNNWRSSDLGIGEINYTLDGKDYEDYGIITKHLISGKIIAGDIYSANYNSTTKEGCHIDLESGSFTLADSKIVYDSVNNKLTLKGMSIDWSTSTTPEVSDIDGLSNTLETQSASITANANAITSEVARAKGAEDSLSSSITQTANSIKSEVSATYETKSDAQSNYTNLSTTIEQTANSITSTVTANYETKNDATTKYNTLQSSITQNANAITLKVEKDSIISTINQSAEAITIKAAKISLEGVVTANNYFKINTDGSMEATNGKFTGTIHAGKGGTIGGFTIGDSAIYKGTDSISSTTPGIYLGTDGIRNYKSDTAKVTIQDGILSANGVNVAGNITVDSGTINGDLILTDTGKLIGRGSSNPNGTTKGKYETIVRGVDNPAYGIFFIRQINDLNSANDDAGTSANNDGKYYYPFRISGNGNLTIGIKKQFQISGTDGSLNIGNGNFQVDGSTGNVTIGGNCTIQGTTTIKGTTSIQGASCTNLTITSGDINFGTGAFHVDTNGNVKASNLNATGGKIGKWSIGNETSISGYLTGYNENTSQFMTLYPNGFVENGKTIYILICEQGGSKRAGLTINGWVSLT